jgi:hypothetical protein
LLRLIEGRVFFVWVSAVDSNGRTIWIADAHRDNGKRLVVRADEKLTAFLELESAISAIALSCLTRFAASGFLLCSRTTNLPFALIHHGRSWSGGGANRISTSSERKIRCKVRSGRLR